MSLSDEKTADLVGLLDGIGEPVTWNGRSYKALVSDPAIGEHLDIGGFTGTGDFTIKIPRKSFDKRLPNPALPPDRRNGPDRQRYSGLSSRRRPSSSPRCRGEVAAPVFKRYPRPKPPNALE